MAMTLKINNAAIRELLKSPGVTAEVQRLAEQVRDATGTPDSYTVSHSPSKNRARFTVYANTAEEEFENGAKNILVRAIGSVKR